MLHFSMYSTIILVSHTVPLATGIMNIVAARLPVPDSVVGLMGYSTEDEMVEALKALPRPGDEPPSCFVGGAGACIN